MLQGERLPVAPKTKIADHLPNQVEVPSRAGAARDGGRLMEHRDLGRGTTSATPGTATSADADVDLPNDIADVLAELLAEALVEDVRRRGSPLRATPGSE
jgi:hypothetical protein